MGSHKNRERIVQAHENEDEDYLLDVDALGVNRSTARGIVAHFIKEGRIHTELSKQSAETLSRL